MDKPSRPRYQVFVSSTFRDLKDERQAILNAILRLHQFPMGMETFPAANQTPWELIERLISDSDFYIVVIGGRYGTEDEKGISYTEKEYDLAVKLNKPVLAFLHAAPDEIPVKNVDTDPLVLEKLQKFRNKVSKHHINTWRTASELQTSMLASLSIAIAEAPSNAGWVRAAGFNNADLMSKLLEAQEMIATLEAQNEMLRMDFDADEVASKFANGDDLLTFEFDYIGETTSRHALTLTWNVVFNILAERLITPCSNHVIERLLIRALLQQFQQQGVYTSGSVKPKIDPKTQQRDERIMELAPIIETILMQFVALGLVDFTYDDRNVNYVLTEKGLKKFVRWKAIPKNSVS